MNAPVHQRCEIRLGLRADGMLERIHIHPRDAVEVRVLFGGLEQQQRLGALKPLFLRHALRQIAAGQQTVIRAASGVGVQAAKRSFLRAAGIEVQRQRFQRHQETEAQQIVHDGLAPLGKVDEGRHQKRLVDATAFGQKALLLFFPQKSGWQLLGIRFLPGKQPPPRPQVGAPILRRPFPETGQLLETGQRSAGQDFPQRPPQQGGRFLPQRPERRPVQHIHGNGRRISRKGQRFRPQVHPAKCFRPCENQPGAHHHRRGRRGAFHQRKPPDDLRAFRLEPFGQTRQIGLGRIGSVRRADHAGQQRLPAGCFGEAPQELLIPLGAEVIFPGQQQRMTGAILQRPGEAFPLAVKMHLSL